MIDEKDKYKNSKEQGEKHFDNCQNVKQNIRIKNWEENMICKPRGEILIQGIEISEIDNISVLINLISLLVDKTTTKN